MGARGAGEALRDQLGMTGHGAKRLSQPARRLEEMPDARANLQEGKSTLANAAGLAAAAEERGLGGRMRTRGCWRRRRGPTRIISASVPAGWRASTARSGTKYPRDIVAHLTRHPNALAVAVLLVAGDGLEQERRPLPVRRTPRSILRRSSASARPQKRSTRRVGREGPCP